MPARRNLGEDGAQSDRDEQDRLVFLGNGKVDEQAANGHHQHVGPRQFLPRPETMPNKRSRRLSAPRCIGVPLCEADQHFAVSHCLANLRQDFGHGSGALARMGFFTFMASSTHTTWPVSTVWPAFASRQDRPRHRGAWISLPPSRAPDARDRECRLDPGGWRELRPGSAAGRGAGRELGRRHLDLRAHDADLERLAVHDDLEGRCARVRYFDVIGLALDRDIKGWQGFQGTAVARSITMERWPDGFRTRGFSRLPAAHHRTG